MPEPPASHKQERDRGSPGNGGTPSRSVVLSSRSVDRVTQ